MMIQYKIQLDRPKIIHHNHLYSIKTRGTYYGIHREMLAANYDPACSKSSLVLFIEKNHAQTFKQFLEHQQKQNKMMERITGDDLINSTVVSTSIQPFDIEKITSNEVEILSLLHFFNLVIVNKVSKKEGGLAVYGYEFLTYDLPNRQILEYQLYKYYGRS